MFVNEDKSPFVKGGKIPSTTYIGSYGMPVCNADGTAIGGVKRVLEQITLAAGAAGTTGTITLTFKPIYNADGSGPITSVDSSFQITSGTALGTFVATAGAVIANGDYHIDAYSGVLTYQKASADTTHEVSYVAGSEGVAVSNFNELQTIEVLDNDYTVTPVTTGAYVQLTAALSADVKEMEIFDSSGQSLIIATGAAAAEVDRFIVVPGGNGRIIENFGAGTRISIIAKSANATVGFIEINCRG